MLFQFLNPPDQNIRSQFKWMTHSKIQIETFRGRWEGRTSPPLPGGHLTEFFVLILPCYPWLHWHHQTQNHRGGNYCSRLYSWSSVGTGAWSPGERTLWRRGIGVQAGGGWTFSRNIHLNIYSIQFKLYICEETLLVKQF